MDDDQPHDSRFPRTQAIEGFGKYKHVLYQKDPLYSPSHEYSAPQVHLQKDNYRQQNENPEAHYQTCKWKERQLGGHKWATFIKRANKALRQHIFHLNTPY